MFFILSKVFYALLLPLTWIISLALYSIFSKRKRRKRLARNFAVLLLVFFSNPFIANMVMRWWELPAVAYQEMTYKYDYVVVLSGIADSMKEPTDRIHFNKGADRIVHGIELLKQKKASKLVITGGSGSLINSDRKEGDRLRDFAIMAGIDTSDIVLENQSRNTVENAIFTKNLIPENSKVIIVTSAFHMRRAYACFKKVNLPVDTFPTDLYSRPLTVSPDAWIVPQTSALQNWNILIKEWVGYMAYWMNGYI